MTDMNDDSLKKALTLQERMAEFAKENDFSRMARQIAASQPKFEVPLGVRNMLAEFNRHDELMKQIIGPSQELSQVLTAKEPEQNPSAGDPSPAPDDN
jgi:L-lysine 2,3-aminomutase